MSRRTDAQPRVLTFAAMIVGALGLGIGVVVAPVPSILVAAFCLCLLIVFRANRLLVAPTILLASAMFSRPNIFGELWASLGLVLAVAAGLLAVVETRGQQKHSVLDKKAADAVMSVLLWIVAAHLWAFANSVFGDTGGDLTSHVSSLVLLVGGLASAVFVVFNAKRARYVAAGIVAITSISCLSFVMSAGLWLILGVGAGQIGTIPVGTHGLSPVYFPFSPTLGTQIIAGTELPRFVGFGREPGWMAAWCGFAYFLLPALLQNRTLLLASRFLLLFGLIGTFSTAGFACFVMTWAMARLLSPRSSRMHIALSYFRYTFGVAIVVLGVWLVLYSPVFGIDAKIDRDPYSAANRFDATMAGLRAAVERPVFGGGAVDDIGGLNVIAAVARYGVPFAIFVLLAFAVPIFKLRSRVGAAAPLMMLMFTLLVAQPPNGSLWVYVAAMVACGAASLGKDPEVDPPGASRAAGGSVSSGPLLTADPAKNPGQGLPGRH